MIVATAGHIDHGKTTLVRALTGVDTDRLPEEKQRGISIDLGFAYWKTPGDGVTVGFVDVPGHERFVRNMLAGVCGIDLALLVVAADDGVMPQTVEHLHIVDLLGVKRGLAVITKADRVGAERVQAVEAEVKALLAPSGLAGIAVMPVSATIGAGMDRLRDALAAAARTTARDRSEGRGLRFAIDRVFSVAGSGTVVTGTVFAGRVAIGDRLLVSPDGREVRVRGVQKDGSSADAALGGERCALNLAGVEVADLHRGDWILAPALHAPTRRLDARVTLLASEPKPLKHWTPAHLHHGAQDVLARVAIRGGRAIAPGASGLVQLVLDDPVAALHGDRFILRDQSALRTLGGGVVIDPQVPLRRRDQDARAAQLAALELDTPEQALRALVAATPAGVDLSWFGRIHNLGEDRLGALVQSLDLAAVGKDPAVVLPRNAVEGVQARALAALEAFHATTPKALGMELSDLRSQCAGHLPPERFLAMLRSLADAKRLEIAGSTARLPRHVATDNPADAKLWARVKPVLAKAAFNGITVPELAAKARLPEPAIKDFLHRKAKTGELVRVTPERFYLKETLAAFAAIATDVHKAVPGGKFSAAQVRDRTGIGRGRVIEILECFDRLGLTQRAGDLRSLRRDYVPLFGPANPR